MQKLIDDLSVIVTKFTKQAGNKGKLLSKNAMDKYSDGIATYKTSEGKCVNIPYKGLAIDIIQDIYGGIRSACTYVGANRIKDFGKKTTFIMVNNTHNRIFDK